MVIRICKEDIGGTSKATDDDAHEINKQDCGPLVCSDEGECQIPEWADD